MSERRMNHVYNVKHVYNVNHVYHVNHVYTPPLSASYYTFFSENTWT